jgi:hypothetical protein
LKAFFLNSESVLGARNKLQIFLRAFEQISGYCLNHADLQTDSICYTMVMRYNPTPDERLQLLWRDFSLEPCPEKAMRYCTEKARQLGGPPTWTVEDLLSPQHGGPGFGSGLRLLKALYFLAFNRILGEDQPWEMGWQQLKDLNAHTLLEKVDIDDFRRIPRNSAVIHSYMSYSGPYDPQDFLHYMRERHQTLFTGEKVPIGRGTFEGLYHRIKELGIVPEHWDLYYSW